VLEDILVSDASAGRRAAMRGSLHGDVRREILSASAIPHPAVPSWTLLCGDEESGDFGDHAPAVFSGDTPPAGCLPPEDHEADSPKEAVPSTLLVVASRFDPGRHQLVRR